MNNPETQATLGKRQCFTKEALEKTKGTVKHEQSRDTDNIGHKTTFYKRSLRENQRDCQALTIQRHRQHWAQDNVLQNQRDCLKSENVQSRDTDNLGKKTMFYKRSF